MSEPTREQLIDHFDSNRCWVEDCVGCKAIRKHLTESDIAHWMDRCHELEAKLAEKPVPSVSRERIKKAVDDCSAEFPIIAKGWDIFEPVMIAILTELGFIVKEE